MHHPVHHVYNFTAMGIKFDAPVNLGMGLAPNLSAASVPAPPQYISIKGGLKRSVPYGIRHVYR